MEIVIDFIEYYLDELKNQLGQFEKKYWNMFPTYFYRPYLIRAQQTSDGIAIRFWRPSKKKSVKVKKSKKQIEETFLPYLPSPKYKAVFFFSGSQRAKIDNVHINNFDFSKDPKKGKKYQRRGEDFHRMSLMHVEGSIEIQMMDCHISGVTDKGRYQAFIKFLWIMTGESVELTEERARWYAQSDFNYHVNEILSVRDPGKLSTPGKKLIIRMLSKIKKNYLELISRTVLDEQEIHGFFEDHRFLIDPNANQMWSKESLGKENQADFILKYDDNIRIVEIKRPRASANIRIVEIKRPHDNIFTGKGTFSATTNKAISEISRYQFWIQENESIARGRYGSDNLQTGWVIIGKRRDMSKNEQEKLASWNSNEKNIELRCFDDLIVNIDLRINQLKNSINK